MTEQELRCRYVQIVCSVDGERFFSFGLNAVETLTKNKPFMF